MSPTFVYLSDAGQTINLAHVVCVVHNVPALNGTVDRVMYADKSYSTAESNADKLTLRSALMRLDLFDGGKE